MGNKIVIGWMVLGFWNTRNPDSIRWIILFEIADFFIRLKKKKKVFLGKMDCDVLCARLEKEAKSNAHTFFGPEIFLLHKKYAKKHLHPLAAGFVT